MSSPEPRDSPVRPVYWALLVLMTLASLGGPFLVWLVLRGGASDSWPPDRLVEWVVFSATCALVATLMLACLALAFANRDRFRTRPPRLTPDYPQAPHSGKTPSS